MSLSSQSGTTPFRKYADSATGGDSHAVCRQTATSVQNHTRSMPSFCTSGSRIGTTISTIGTHSSGQPSTKIIASISSSMIVGEKLSVSSDSAMRVAEPSRENTAPKKLDAATSNRIMHDTSSVEYTAFLSFCHVMRR